MERLGIPVRDGHGSLRAVEAYRDHDTVELWFGGRLGAALSRELLARWFEGADGEPLVVGQVSWLRDSTGAVTIALAGGDVSAPVSPRTLRWLTTRGA